ncbi:hypothetical protein CEY12_14430 [Chryseobacterium sp. T16E-39]|uniref:hypothetical protein n=1 Tax=Chryseobacterium sp. T16E-39 TaxID=2015076 RepID=UPI000B5B2977|nr:hypothetical protein [Chryseobacterium sp. T16E-39]ASK31224.1 hypothetical protein CEY12_14430 [Chryseobacterium sp. T16E-39]
MKKLLQIVCSFMIITTFSQGKETIKFKGNIWNYENETYKSLTVIDQREDKNIGTLPFGDQKEMKEVAFPTTPENDLGSWYSKSNDEGRKSESVLVLVLKKLKLNVGETVGKNTIGTIDFSAQTFSKEGSKYRFLYKKDTVFTLSHKDVAEFMVKNISTIFSVFITKTYHAKPIGNTVSVNELSDYESYLKNNYEVYKRDQLKDGVYLDHVSFFNQKPEPGNYLLEKNDKGEVTKAIKEENGKKNKISAYKMFVYVENGKAYKRVLSGFLELNQNEKGFYIVSNRGYLFPAGSSGLGMFGLIGSVADVIQQGAEQKKMKKGDKTEIYIDPLTGEYDFPTE